MPNHVENRLTFECSPEELHKILEDIQYDPDRSNEEYTGIGTFDFNKIVPMPESLNMPTHVRVEAAESGLLPGSVVMLEQIRTIDKTRLGRLVGHLDEETMKRIEQAAECSLGIKA